MLTILSEWFLLSESNLLPYAILMIVMSFALATRVKKKTQLITAAICLVLFVIAGLVVESHADWIWIYIALFLGGFALFLGLGMISCYLYRLIKDKTSHK
jgi:predicted tellurium resistance membrane protein TerC